MNHVAGIEYFSHKLFVLIAFSLVAKSVSILKQKIDLQFIGL